MRSTDVGELMRSAKYVFQSAVCNDGEKAIEIYPLKPPKLRCITLSKIEDEDASEEFTDLPPAVATFYMSKARARLYVTKDGEKRALLFDAKALELWDGPVASIAEFRKHLLAYMCDDKESEQVPFEFQKAVGGAIAHLMGKTCNLCGCGTEVHTLQKPFTLCQSCHAILCEECRKESKYCNGCFRILQESANDIGDDEDDIFVDE